MQARQLNTLAAAVKVSLLKLGDDQARYFARLTPFAYDFWKDYVADTARENRTVELAVLPDQTCALPDDYDQYVMIGLRNGQYVRNLRHNAALLSLPPETDGLREVGAVTEPDGVVPQVVLRHNYIGWEYGTLEGVGYPEFGGEVKVEPEQRRIVCSSEVPAGSTIILQYFSFSSDPSEGWVIDPLWHKALHLYLSWHFYLYVKREPQQAREFERLYREEAMRADRRSRPFSLASIQQANFNAANTFPK